jgi:hypothetical protein
VRENLTGAKLDTAIRRFKPEQIVTLLRQIEVGIANGKTTPPACREAEITVQTFYRWRKEFGGLKLDQAKGLKELEKENSKLKRLRAGLSLEKQVPTWIVRDVEVRFSKTMPPTANRTSFHSSHRAEELSRHWLIDTSAFYNHRFDLGRGDFAVPVSASWDGSVLMNQFPLAVSSLEAIRFAH